MTPDVPGMGDLEPGLDLDVLRRRREIVATLSALALILLVTAAAAYYFLHPKAADLHEIVGVAEKSVESALGPGIQCRYPPSDHHSSKEPQKPF